jgi:hypothetical protein
MAVHGKYGRACPVCGDPVQRIVYAANETNYCATLLIHFADSKAHMDNDVIANGSLGDQG